MKRDAGDIVRQTDVARLTDVHDQIGRLLGWEQITFEIKGESDICTGAWRHPVKHPIDDEDFASGKMAPEYTVADIIDYWNLEHAEQVRFGAQKTPQGEKVWWCRIGRRRPVWADSKFAAAKTATLRAMIGAT